MSAVPDRVARLRGFLAADPDNLSLACALLQAHLDAHDLTGGATELANLRPRFGAAPELQLIESRLALLQGEFRRAMALLEALLPAVADPLALRCDLAFAALCARDPEAALAALAPIADRWPEQPLVLRHKARALQLAGRLDEAVAAIEPLAAQAPDDVETLALQALLLFDSGALDAAAPLAERALRADPRSIEAALVAAGCALASRDLERAEAVYGETLARHPDCGRAWSGNAQVRMLRQDLVGAERDLLAATNHMPDHIGTWHLLGWTQLLLGQRERAGASFRRALELDRNFGESHGAIAVVAALDGDLDGADAAAKRALRLDPGSRAGRYARAIVLARRGDRAQAETLLRDIVRGAAPQTAVPDEAIARLLAGELRRPPATGA